MSLTPALKTILSEAGCPDSVGEFLIKESLFLPADLALLAADEKSVDTKIVAPMKAAGVKLDRLKDVVSVTKAWVLSRAATDKETDSRAGKVIPQALESPLPEPTLKDLKAAWTARHRFELNMNRFLTDVLVGKLYRELNGEPRKLSIIFLEHMRVLSSTDKSTTQLMIPLKPGEATRTTEINVDEIKGTTEIYWRIRAFFTTVSFVTIQEPTFMPFQEVEFAADTIHGFLSNTFDGHHPPLNFFINAWAATSHYLAEEVRTNKKDLKTAIRQTSAWQHFWTVWTPPTSGKAAARKEGTSSTPNLPSDLESEVLRLRKHAATLQSQKDRLENQHKRGGKRDRSNDRGGRYERSPLRRRENDRDRQQPRRGKGGGRR